MAKACLSGASGSNEKISNTYLIEGLTGGPFRSLFKDPESAGLVRFDRYYLFGSGDNLTNTSGTTFPLTSFTIITAIVSFSFLQEVNVVVITRAKTPNNTVLKILFSIIIVSL